MSVCLSQYYHYLENLTASAHVSKGHMMKVTACWQAVSLWEWCKPLQLPCMLIWCWHLHLTYLIILFIWFFTFLQKCHEAVNLLFLLIRASLASVCWTKCGRVFIIFFNTVNHLTHQALETKQNLDFMTTCHKHYVGCIADYKRQQFSTRARFPTDNCSNTDTFTHSIVAHFNHNSESADSQSYRQTCQSANTAIPWRGRQKKFPSA